MLKKPAVLITLAVLALLLLAGAVISLPAVRARLDWRVDFGIAYLRGVIHPVGPLPTPLPKPRVQVNSLPDPKPTSAPTVPPGPTPTSPPPPTPIPGKVLLDPPAWEKQDINNCGPATLTMYLRHYGWEGNQKDIADVLKPHRQDRNVNVEELAYYVHTKAGWLNFIYRVGGDEELLKKLIAAGIPVMVEESFHFESPYWPNDDLWAAHYNLLTGYDDQKQSFTTQDSFYGADLQVAYDQLAQNWQSFNHVYILIYPPELETVVQDVLGPEWDADVNRQHALDGAQAATQEDPQNSFNWFNLGTNLVYFDRYTEAALAYDQARTIGLPQRMLRYQFGPFFAYFHSGRLDDLQALLDYALARTPNAEEAWLWQGWARYRQGKTGEAIADFQKALEENPNDQDAQYALAFVRENP